MVSNLNRKKMSIFFIASMNSYLLNPLARELLTIPM